MPRYRVSLVEWAGSGNTRSVPPRNALSISSAVTPCLRHFSWFPSSQLNPSTASIIRSEYQLYVPMSTRSNARDCRRPQRHLLANGCSIAVFSRTHRPAARVEAAPLATERHELLGVTARAAHAQEPMLQPPALQVILELALHVPLCARWHRGSRETSGNGGRRSGTATSTPAGGAHNSRQPRIASLESIVPPPCAKARTVHSNSAHARSEDAAAPRENVCTTVNNRARMRRVTFEK